jgi:hypothetical protein
MTAAITTVTLPAGQIGQAYEAAVGLTGATHTTLAVATGSLPPGLAVTDVRITGTPTHIGTYTFTLSDAGATSGSVSITVTYPDSAQLAAGNASVVAQLATEWRTDG